MRRTPPAAIAGLLLLAASPARADDAKARAQQLFQEGVAAIEKGDASSGCAKLQESLGLFAVPNALFLVAAQCEEPAGKLTAALGHWRRGLALVDAKDKRATKARERVAALEGKVPRLNLVLPAGQAAPKLLLDRQLDLATLGAPLLLDPGKHVLVVRAAGREDRTFEVVLGVGDRTEVVAAVGAAATAAPTAVPGAAPPPPGTAPAAPASPAGSGLRTGGFVTLGIGGAGLIAAAITGGIVMAHKAAADEACGSDLSNCRSVNRDSLNRDKTLLAGNGVAWGVGIAGVVTGAVLLIVSAKANKAPAVTATPVVQRDGGGLWLTGRF